MEPIPLPNLFRWYEDNVFKTTTLSIVRSVVQGNLPNLPLDRISSLGKYWQEFEVLRECLKDSEFELFLQCQMLEYKHACEDGYRLPIGFYISYLVSNESMDRYEKNQEKLRFSGYHSCRSEVYRACFPAECTALRDYFLRYLQWNGSKETEPIWQDVQLEFAKINHPFWTYFSFKHPFSGFEKEWISGKSKLYSRSLLQDANEYDRACIEGLIFTARQLTILSDDFLIDPLSKEFSYPYQVAVQLYSKREEFMSNSPVLQISLTDE